jgi:hypothetical protein
MYQFTPLYVVAIAIISPPSHSRGTIVCLVRATNCTHLFTSGVHLRLRRNYLPVAIIVYIARGTHLSVVFCSFIGDETNGVVVRNFAPHFCTRVIGIGIS